MKTRVITFRLDPDSEPGRIFAHWQDAGYEPRRIIENALRCLEGIEPPAYPTMNASALAALESVVARLEAVLGSIQQNGGVVTAAHQQEIEEALDPRFLQGMRRIVRPGFTRRPEED